MCMCDDVVAHLFLRELIVVECGTDLQNKWDLAALPPAVEQV